MHCSNPRKISLIISEKSWLRSRLFRLNWPQCIKHKETFRALFEQHDSGQATLDFLDWMADAQALFGRAVRTMTRWLGEILQYFEHRTTSALSKLNLGVNGHQFTASILNLHL
ncbi:MAG: transposase, partial [Cyanobacteria bacterium J06560_5]